MNNRSEQLSEANRSSKDSSLHSHLSSQERLSSQWWRAILVFLFALLFFCDEILAETALNPADSAVTQYQASVEGMTCGGCASTIRKALTENSAISEVKVNLEQQLVTVAATQANLSDLISEQITEAGFTVKEVTVLQVDKSSTTPSS